MAAIMAAIMEITENIMRRMREPSTKLHNALYFMSGMMVVILALVIVAGVKTKAESISNWLSRCSWWTRCVRTLSAMVLRQMLPWQMNNTFIIVA